MPAVTVTPASHPALYAALACIWVDNTIAQLPTTMRFEVETDTIEPSVLLSKADAELSKLDYEALAEFSCGEAVDSLADELPHAHSVLESAFATLWG